MIGAIGPGGVRAAVTVGGAADGELFRLFVADALVPSLRPGDVVVMDNLAAHKSAAVRRLVEAAGASVWFLPAYSPDLNPIEKGVAPR